MLGKIWKTEQKTNLYHFNEAASTFCISFQLFYPKGL